MLCRQQELDLLLAMGGQLTPSMHHGRAPCLGVLGNLLMPYLLLGPALCITRLVMQTRPWRMFI